VLQAAAPERLIKGGLPTEAMVASVLVANTLSSSTSGLPSASTSSCRGPGQPSTRPENSRPDATSAGKSSHQAPRGQKAAYYYSWKKFLEGGKRPLATTDGSSSFREAQA
jgi:hypothetical protein